MASANPELDADDVAALIAEHTAALLAMVDEYRGQDYEAAYGTVAEAYVHMFTVGDALAAAIAAQFPKRFVDIARLPATDAAAGPADGLDRDAWAPLLAAVALAGAVSALLRGRVARPPLQARANRVRQHLPVVPGFRR